jgi:hypothetical protein
MKAMPITPWATVRIVPAASVVNTPPRCTPNTRSKIARLARAPDSPKAITMPATMKARMN